MKQFQKYKKIIDISLLFLFILLITAPLMRLNFETGIISSTENRILSAFPKIKDSDDKFNINFRSEFETFLNDNIGFRVAIFNIKNFIDFTFFRNSYPGEKIGKDNWLFLLTPSSVSRSQNNDLYTIDKLAFFSKRFTEITSYYNARDIEFYIMVFPHKVDIYSEYLPNTILKINKQSAIEQAKEYFENNPNFNFQVPIQPFFDAKKEKLIYSKAADNAHWNNYGAFIGYTLLMSQVKEHILNIKILTTDDFNIIPIKRDTYRAGKLFVSETDYEFELKKSVSAIESKSYLLDIGFQSEDRSRSYNYYSNVDNSLPCAIIIGDSYIWMFMLPHLAESFSKMVFINTTDIKQLPDLVDKIKPDIIICTGLYNVAYSASNIDISSNPGQTISEIISNRKEPFAQKIKNGWEIHNLSENSSNLERIISDDKVIHINLDKYDVVQGFEISPDIDHTPPPPITEQKYQQWIYKTTQNDSYVYYDFYKFVNPDYILFEFGRIPEDMVMEILYTYGDDLWSNYGEQRINIQGGYNKNYLLKFENSQSINRLRFCFRNAINKEFKIKNIYIFEK